MRDKIVAKSAYRHRSAKREQTSIFFSAPANYAQEQTLFGFRSYIERETLKKHHDQYDVSTAYLNGQ
jgi:hypothetical protein